MLRRSAIFLLGGLALPALLAQTSASPVRLRGVIESVERQTLTLRYPDGEKTVVVPEGIPVVTFRPGEVALLKPGARAFVVAALVDGRPTVTRLVVGRDGFAPPM